MKGWDVGEKGRKVRGKGWKTGVKRQGVERGVGCRSNGTGCERDRKEGEREGMESRSEEKGYGEMGRRQE